MQASPAWSRTEDQITSLYEPLLFVSHPILLSFCSNELNYGETQLIILQACESHAFLIRACEWVWQVVWEEACIERANCCSTTRDLVRSHLSLPGPALNSAGLFPNRNFQSSLDFALSGQRFKTR